MQDTIEQNAFSSIATGASVAPKGARAGSKEEGRNRHDGEFELAEAGHRLHQDLRVQGRRPAETNLLPRETRRADIDYPRNP